MPTPRLSRFRLTLLPCALALLLGGCMMGPDYVRPAAPEAPRFKEAEGWQTAQPQDTLPRGNWWAVFEDPQLDALMAQVDINNQNVKLAEAQYRQSRALVVGSEAGLLPTLSANAGVTRSQGGSSGASANNSVKTNYSANLAAAWEIDLWGRLRRGLEEAGASAQASAADLEAARLSARAALAQNYFQLRVTDAQKRLLDETVDAYTKSLELTQNRYKVGVATRADIVQAQTQLKSAQAQALDVAVTRAQLEHAIALLVGKAPSEFNLPPAPLAARVPQIPAGLPSTLLQRRPDIAAAERRMGAANAQIGVTQAAFFPTLSLSASGGFQSSNLANWFSLPNRVWSIGPTLAASLFDGGLRRAQKEQALAAYDASIATYRQTVLTAFGQVEDNLAALRILEEEEKVEQDALRNARESVTLTTNQYKAGTVNYLSVVQVQTTAYSAENTVLNVRNRRFAACVALIKALGGGWQAGDKPVAQ